MNRRTPERAGTRPCIGSEWVDATTCRSCWNGARTDGAFACYVNQTPRRTRTETRAAAGIATPMPRSRQQIAGRGMSQESRIVVGGKRSAAAPRAEIVLVGVDSGAGRLGLVAWQHGQALSQHAQAGAPVAIGTHASASNAGAARSKHTAKMTEKTRCTPSAPSISIIRIGQPTRSLASKHTPAAATFRCVPGFVRGPRRWKIFCATAACSSRGRGVPCTASDRRRPQSRIGSTGRARRVS